MPRFLAIHSPSLPLMYLVLLCDDFNWLGRYLADPEAHVCVTRSPHARYDGFNLRNRNPNWVESLTLKAPRSACASTFRLLMKLSKSDDARTGENIKKGKHMTERMKKMFFMIEPP